MLQHIVTIKMNLSLIIINLHCYMDHNGGRQGMTTTHHGVLQDIFNDEGISAVTKRTVAVV